VSLSFSTIHQHIGTSQPGTSLKIPSWQNMGFLDLQHSQSAICSFHYCGTGGPWIVASATQTTCCEVWSSAWQCNPTQHMDTELLQLFHWEVLGHPPYCLCWIYSNEEVQTATNNGYKCKKLDFHSNGILKPVPRWDKCINVLGDYVTKILVLECNKWTVLYVVMTSGLIFMAWRILLIDLPL